MNPNRKILQLIVILAFAGLVTAAYDFIARAYGIALWCPFAGNGCDIVQNSAYALILGIPLSFLGILAFGFYIVVASIASFSPAMVGKLSSASTYFCVYLLLAFNIVDLISLAYFIYLELTVIHAICSLCMFVAALNVAIGIALVSALATRRCA